jgi:hypothetical protein
VDIEFVAPPDLLYLKLFTIESQTAVVSCSNLASLRNLASRKQHSRELFKTIDIVSLGLQLRFNDFLVV